MSESEQTNLEQKDTSQSAEAQMGETQPEPPVGKPNNMKNIPDWQPLGAIRDYFTEQMKQDFFHR